MEYIEGLAGLWCTALGFGEERLVDAPRRQRRRLTYYQIYNHKSHDTAAERAERLIALMPVKMSKVFFNNSGSEANDPAVKMVWYYNNARGRHRKKKIIARMKGYHGVTVAAASLTGLPNNHRDFDLPIDNIRHADCPHHYRFAKPGESEEAFATRLAESLEAQILREDPDILAQVRKGAPRLQNGMRRFATHPLVGEVRGIGPTAAAELVQDKASKAPFGQKQGVGAPFAARAQEPGLILRALADTVAL